MYVGFFGNGYRRIVEQAELSHWGMVRVMGMLSGLKDSVAKRMEDGENRRPGRAHGWQPCSVLLIASSGDPVWESAGQWCPVIKERHVCN